MTPPTKEQLLSKYSEFDLDGDGEVTETEIEHAEKMVEIELREEKLEAQKYMAWSAIVIMCVTTIFLFTPIIPDSRVDHLSELLGLFYFAMCGIVGTYMGATAFMHRTKLTK